ncbi:MAG: tRNA uridine-5-carboxymethylaminomethyl(34) synthesis enzyme MnmG [Oscillospiraceae bacterium]|nr:tRNA uridine-5-carboxymethylaminomethyl(34) synthesis enzyme MnmG [Oscillospiraceae bacterium]MBR5071430.1 tRNA uridine-5-carboxymethylaminomethyl(34) synthesis enzyme MnmG [Oscillospiraceae bacterium]
MFEYKSYDVAVIGAGHAGIEAALAAARLGCRTAVFTITLDAIGNMPCNPSIGGTGKGHLVMELDALGGEMGKAADATMLQSRMLNLAKGPAVHSLRVQSDRRAYHRYMKAALEAEPNLDIFQDEVIEIKTENGAVSGVKTSLGGDFPCKAAVICTGTYLGGKIFVGDAVRHSGPDGVCPADRLTQNLVDLGLPIRRFKTGTPARVHSRSIDYSVLERQDGDENIVPFCFDRTEPLENTRCCWIAYTNEQTHEVIRRNLSRSPLYGGAIVGIGPRYCPSIEDKVVRFPDKKRHQLFIEPCGANTEEMYLQGMSSSLPLDVQYEMYRTIKGLEHVEIMRPAYAIEYDCCDPTELYATLQSKRIKGLFGAGQFNGTSGYEEAAVQGFVAGVNAAHTVLGREPFVLSRKEAYIGTLIDDLVTKGVNDPYRMMTSRCEYRLILRQDNADERMCGKGRALGLLSEEKYQVFLANHEALEKELDHIRHTVIHATDEVNSMLVALSESPLTGGISADALLKRPNVRYTDLLPFLHPDGDVPSAKVQQKAEIEIKYEGYLKRQSALAEKLSREDELELPEDIDYKGIKGLRLEAADKLDRIRPASFGQAARISGVNPADLQVLSVWLAKHRRGAGKGDVDDQ